jgi:hypothetical protein
VISFARLKIAKQKGKALLKQEGITTLPVDPFAIAASHDILVEAKTDAADGVSGMLRRHGDTFGIHYATYVRNGGFQRYSISHELGHYFLHGHVDHLLPGDGIHSSRAGFISGDPYELEADNFAAGLLMPATLYKRLITRRDPSLDAVEALASDCRTSLTATAIRFAELTDDAVAVIISTGNVIDYCILSEAMKSLPQLSWLKKGSAVPMGTATARLSASAERVLRGDRAIDEIDVMDWLGGTRSAVVTEEVVGLGPYGKTLTILSSSRIGHKEDGLDDDDNDAEIVERWTPRFRR